MYGTCALIFKNLLSKDNPDPEEEFGASLARIFSCRLTPDKCGYAGECRGFINQQYQSRTETEIAGAPASL